MSAPRSKGRQRRGRPPKPFDRAELLVRFKDLSGPAGVQLCELVVDAKLSDREAAVWLTFWLTHLDPTIIGVAARKGWSLADIARLQGCTRQNVHPYLKSAAAKIAAHTGTLLLIPPAPPRMRTSPYGDAEDVLRAGREAADTSLPDDDDAGEAGDGLPLQPAYSLEEPLVDDDAPEAEW
jgi:hypothetical protein